MLSRVVRSIGRIKRNNTDEVTDMEMLDCTNTIDYIEMNQKGTANGQSQCSSWNYFTLYSVYHCWQILTYIFQIATRIFLQFASTFQKLSSFLYKLKKLCVKNIKLELRLCRNNCLGYLLEKRSSIFIGTSAWSDTLIDFALSSFEGSYGVLNIYRVFWYLCAYHSRVKDLNTILLRNA